MHTLKCLWSEICYPHKVFEKWLATGNLLSHVRSRVKTFGLFKEALKETKVHIQVQVHNATAWNGRIVLFHGNRHGWLPLALPFALKQDMSSAEQAPQSNNHVREWVWHVVHDAQQFGHHSSLRNKLRRIHSNDRTYIPNEFI